MSQKCHNIPKITCFCQTIETSREALGVLLLYWKVSLNPVSTGILGQNWDILYSQRPKSRRNGSFRSCNGGEAVFCGGSALLRG